MTKTVNIDGKEYIIEFCKNCPFYDWGDAGFLDECQYPLNPSNLKETIFVKGLNEIAKDCPLKDAKESE